MNDLVECPQCGSIVYEARLADTGREAAELQGDLDALRAQMRTLEEALEGIKALLDPPTATVRLTQQGFEVETLRSMPTEWAITQVRGIVQTALRARYRYRAAHGEEVSP